MLGAERLVYGQLGDAPFTVRIDAHAAAARSPATRCTLHVTPEHLHWFDAAARHAVGASARRVRAARCRERCSAWPYPLWVAHRGAGKLAPENTLAAFRLGAAHGYRMFECDVKLSADGVPFLLHDATLERTTAGDGVAGELPWAELARLDAGGWHSARLRRRAAAEPRADRALLPAPTASR